MEPILPDYFLEIHIIVLSIIIPAAFMWIKRKVSCISKIERRSLRQSKALILLSNKIDDSIRELHPDDPEPKFLRDVENELEDEHGNL